VFKKNILPKLDESKEKDSEFENWKPNSSPRFYVKEEGIQENRVGCDTQKCIIF